MSDSILTSTKKILGLDESYTAFDPDIIMHINTIFSVLYGLGLGPADGFSIEDNSAVWEDFLGDDKRLNSIKTYMYLRVRMLFDPPTTSFLQSAMQDQIRELEFRISVQRENEAHPQVDILGPNTIDGGGVIPDPYNAWVLDGGSP